MSTAFASATPRLPINLDWAIFDWNLPSWVFAAVLFQGVSGNRGK